MYYVEVLVAHKEWREIYAVTEADAAEQARHLPDVIGATQVVHWSDRAEVQPGQTHP